MRLAMMSMSALLVFAAALHDRRFNQLHAIETYEIRPGILASPIYSNEGEVCSIVMEKRHVSSKGVDLDAEMSGEEIHRIFDELAPRRERSQSRLNLEDNGETTIFDGGTLTTTAAYENVTLQMYGKYKEVGERSYVAAIIQWKRGNCSHNFPAGGDGL